jgi:hypothetical protein
MDVFEVVDKTGREIKLPGKSWAHITTTHAEMTNYLGEIRQTVENPLKITLHTKGDLRNYFTYQKHRKHPERYLRVIVTADQLNSSVA